MSGYTENLTSIVWRNPEFLAHFGGLNESNVLDYFSESPFWDRQSTNQALRMQTMYSLGQGSLNESEELLRFVGTEFALVFANSPSTFVIHKRNRTSPTETNAIAAYYVMNANVYQAPDLYSILSSRLLTSLHSFRTSLDLVKEKAPLFDPRKGYVWDIEKASITASTAAASLTAAQTDSEPTVGTPAAPGASAAEKVDGGAKQKSNSERMNAEAMIWMALNTTANDMGK